MARPQNGVNGNLQHQNFGFGPHGFNMNAQGTRNHEQKIFGFGDIQQVVPNQLVSQAYSTSINQSITNTIRPTSSMVGQPQYTIIQYPQYSQSPQLNHFSFQPNFIQAQQYPYTQERYPTVPINVTPKVRKHSPLIIIDPSNKLDLDLSKYQSSFTTETKILKSDEISCLPDKNIEKIKENEDAVHCETEINLEKSIKTDIIEKEDCDMKRSDVDENLKNLSSIEKTDTEEDCSTQCSTNGKEEVVLTSAKNESNYFLQINKKESDETTLRKKLIYDREYLITIKSHSRSQKKPDNLPLTCYFSEEIIYNESQNISCNKPEADHTNFNSIYKKQPQKIHTNNYRKPVKQFQPKQINLDHTESQVFERLKSSYLPPQLRNKDANNDPQIELKRNIKCNLNKITPQNFQECLSDISKLNIKEPEEMSCLINEIFNKAVQEEAYSVTYAQFCNKLANIYAENQTFKGQLLRRCQDMFQTPIQDQLDNVRNDWVLKINNECDQKIKDLYTSDLEEQVKKAKDRYFGNIRFIGELFLHNLLAGKVILNCIIELLRGKTDSDALLALCKLMETCGKQIDERNKDQMNSFIGSMDELSKSKELETRIRFKLKDIVDMRKRKWILRHVQQERKIKPQTLEEQKEEAVADAALAASKLLISQTMNKKSHHNNQNNSIRRQVSAPAKPFQIKKLTFSSHPVDSTTVLGPSRSNWTAGSGYKSKPRDDTSIPQNSPSKSNAISRSREPSLGKWTNKCRTLESSADFSGADSRSNSPSINNYQKITKAYRIKSDTKLTITDSERSDIIFNDLLKKGFFDIHSWSQIRDVKPIIEKWIDDMLEKDASCRKSVGDCFVNLINKRLITYDQLVEGSLSFTSCIDDLIYDIPKLWEFFAQFLERFICDKNSKISFFENIFKNLLPNEDVARCLSLALHAASSRLGHNIVGQVFRKSSLRWDRIVPNQWEKFVQLHDLNFTILVGMTSSPSGEISLQSMSEKLERMLSENYSNEDIFDYMEKHIDKTTWGSVECTRTVTTSIIRAVKSIPKFKIQSYLKDKAEIIKQVCHKKIDNEIEVLRSVLNAAGELDKELLIIIYDVIMTGRIVSNNAFNYYLEDISFKSQPNFDITFQLISQFFDL